jgi:uncharacterized repeat protein (TIGR01451 family)
VLSRALSIVVACAVIATTSTVGLVTEPAVASASTLPPQLHKLYSEDFEASDSADAVMLDQYRGANGETYGADPYWLDGKACNGVITSGTTAAAFGCASFSALRLLATALSPSHADTSNHAIAMYTNGDAQSSAGTQLRTLQPIALPSGERFVSMGVDAAAMNCNQSHPLLAFYIQDAETLRRVSKKPIDPCTDVNSETVVLNGTSIRTGSFISDGGILVSNGAVEIVLKNEQLNAIGNDGAIDNLVLVDSTPTLSAATATDHVVAGDTIRGTFTVQNTSEKGAKSGWSFSESLPAGISVAAEPEAQTTCDAASWSPRAGASDLDAVGTLASGAASCSLSVNLTAMAPGTFALGGDATTTHGLVAGDAAQIVAAPENNSLAATLEATVREHSDSQVVGVGEHVEGTFHVRNTGNAAVDDLRLEIADATSTCSATALLPGESATCPMSSHVVTQNDVDSGGIDISGIAHAESRLGSSVSSDVASTRIATSSNGGLELALIPGASSALKVGDRPGFSAKVTNTGDLTLKEIRVAASPDGPSTLCVAGTLAPGKAADCAIDEQSTVDQGEIDEGLITFAAQASGVSSRDEVVESNPASGATAIDRRPNIAATASAHTDGDAEAPQSTDHATLRVAVENTGNTTLAQIDAAFGDAALVCPTTALPPGGAVDCESEAIRLTQSDIDEGSIDYTVKVDARAGQLEAKAEAKTSLRLPSAPKVEIHAEFDRASGVPGETVGQSFFLHNSGNRTLSDLKITSNRFSRISCDVSSVAPGAEARCRTEAGYVVAAGDAVNDVIVFDSVASAAVSTQTGAAGEKSGRPVPTAIAAPIRIFSDPIHSELPIRRRTSGTLAQTGTESPTPWLALTTLMLAIGSGMVLNARKRSAR